MQSLQWQDNSAHSLRTAKRGHKEETSFQIPDWSIRVRKGSCSILKSSYIITFQRFQTTVGHLLCEQEVHKYNRKKVIHICLSKNGDGSELRQIFKKNFSQFVDLESYSRTSCCEKFLVDDQDDNIELIKTVISKIPESSVVFFDEVPIYSKPKGKKVSYDWTDLHSWSRDISVIVSLQPISYKEVINGKPCRIKVPKEADAIVFIHQYRSSSKLQNLVNTLCQQELPVEFAELTTKTSHDVEGPDITVVTTDVDLTSNPVPSSYLNSIRNFFNSQLKQIQYTSEIKVICDSSTEDLAREVFCGPGYDVTTIDCVEGCEYPVVIIFLPNYNNIGRKLDPNLLNMASRCQVKLFLCLDDPFLLDILHEMKDVDFINLRWVISFFFIV